MKLHTPLWILALWLAAGALGFGQHMNTPSPANTNSTELATLGGGCFWCVEAVYQRIPGVKAVHSGYAGGKNANPTYEEVCTGLTGHAEVIQLEFDPKRTSFEKILEVFWLAHDPTTLNRQGADSGTQYRSVIFYHNDHQRQVAEKSKQAAAAHFRDPIVTQIVPLTKFYPAENYHQSYFNNNQNAPYCSFVIKPKLDKVLKQLKAEAEHK